MDRAGAKKRQPHTPANPNSRASALKCASHIFPERGHFRPIPWERPVDSTQTLTSPPQAPSGLQCLCYVTADNGHWSDLLHSRGPHTYHPPPSRPCSGLQARLRGIPDLLPTPRFSPHSSVHPFSAVAPSISQLPLCYVTKPKAEVSEGCRKRVPTVVLRCCPGSTTVAAPC